MLCPTSSKWPASPARGRRTRYLIISWVRNSRNMRIHILSRGKCIINNVFFLCIYVYRVLLWFTESKYKNLCAACENPSSCYNTDKYYGREGALLCLTDNVGDVTWVRLDDARVHFKVKIVHTRTHCFWPRQQQKKKNNSCNYLGRTDNVICWSKRNLRRIVARVILSNAVLTSAMIWCRPRWSIRRITSFCARTAPQNRLYSINRASGYRNHGRSS